MTTTTAVILNASLALAVIGALAAVIRLAHRLPDRRRAEALHPSQPILLALAREDEETLAQAA